MKPRPLFKILFLLCIVLISCSSLNAQDQWQVVSVNNEPYERHKNAFILAGNKFYLIGGRGIKPTDIYDPSTQTWTEGAPAPIEISHVQAISHEGLIYVMGGLTGN